MTRKPARFDFNLTGFVISLVIVSIFAATFALFLGGIEDYYGISSNSSLDHYDQTQAIVLYAQDINQSLQITQDKGILDVIGGYFSSGYSALRIALGSFGIFDTLMNNAAADFEFFGFFKVLFVTLILVGLIMLGISLLLKPGGKI